LERENCDERSHGTASCGIGANEATEPHAERGIGANDANGSHARGEIGANEAIRGMTAQGAVNAWMEHDKARSHPR
jgi:hypothetical protein